MTPAEIKKREMIRALLAGQQAPMGALGGRLRNPQYEDDPNGASDARMDTPAPPATGPRNQPSILTPGGFGAYNDSRLGAERTFAPGPGTKVAQNVADFVPEGMTAKEWRDTQWDEQVADAYDKEAAKSAIEWTVDGKREDVGKSLAQLREAQAKLESGANNLSGPLVGSWLGQQLAPAFNPESTVTKEAIEEVVQRNLRLVLGTQFTEKEGERLISRAFNPKLQEPENAKRVGRLLQSIEDAASARESASQYFMQNGTLAGWSGRIPDMSDIESSIDAGDSPASDDGWTVVNGVRMRVKQQ